jgi:BetI-type transcriptional repressor, C-terminal
MHHERQRHEQEQRYAEWRGLLDKLVRRARPRDDAAELCTAVDLIAGAVDGLGIQAVLEPASFTPARLRRAASAIVSSVL